MSTVVKDLGAVSAYAYAVEKGYTGTEAEFAELMADYAEVGQRAEDAADSALESKTAAQTAATTATNKATEATTAATTATTKAGEASTSASTATSAKDTAVSASQTATSKATEATTAAATATSAATTATTAKDDAVSAKTAAQTAQTGAETAAASVSASAAQIATNAEDISQLKSDLNHQYKQEITYTASSSGNYWLDFPIVSGHDYLVKNSSESVGTVIAKSVNRNNYDYIETLTPFYLTPNAQVLFRAGQNAKKVNLYANNSATITIADLCTVDSLYGENGNTANYQKYNIQNEDLTQLITWTYGYSIGQNGAISSSTTFRYSSLVPISVGEYSIVIDTKQPTLNTRVHGYDSNGDWVKQITVFSNSTTGIFSFTFAVDDTIKYIRISVGYDLYVSDFLLISGKTLYSQFQENAESTEDKYAHSIIDESITSETNWRKFKVEKGHTYRVINASSANTKISVWTTNGNNYNYIDKVKDGSLLSKGEIVDFTATGDATTLFIYANGSAVVSIIELTTISELYAENQSQNAIIDTTQRSYNETVTSVNRIAYGFSAPQQSIAGYKQAYDAGFRNLLCDIRFTSDNVPVCFHDSYFNETFQIVKDNNGNFVSTNPPVYIANIASTDLDDYDVGKYKALEYTGTRILLFEDMLYLCKALGVTVYLELKINPTTEQYNILFDLIRDYGMELFTVWAPQNIEQLNALTDYEPNVYIQFHSNTAGTYTDMPDTYISAIVSKVNDYNRNRVTITLPSTVAITDAQLKTLSDAGVGICTGTVSDEAYLLNYLARGKRYRSFKESLSDYIVVGKYLHDHIDSLT
jgi:hypothetical protein